MRAHILWLGGMGGCNGTQVGTRQRLGDGERRKTGVGSACEEEEGGRGEGGGRRGRVRKEGAYRGGKREDGDGRGERYHSSPRVPVDRERPGSARKEVRTRGGAGGGNQS